MIRIGTAGWAIPGQFKEQFGACGSALRRYAGRFGAVEINSTFYRPHKPDTFARWAAAVPPDFRFSVKLPKAITHERRLLDAGEPLRAFLAQIEPLKAHLGPLLVQLPPSLAFDAEAARSFLQLMRGEFPGPVAVEPRHPTWFEAEADELLASWQVARAAADPARVPSSASPGGWQGLAYHRLHGSPHMYRSGYDTAFLSGLAERLEASKAAETWCIFDNTMLGAATDNALWLSERLSRGAAGIDGKA